MYHILYVSHIYDICLFIILFFELKFGKNFLGLNARGEYRLIVLILPLA